MYDFSHHQMNASPYQDIASYELIARVFAGNQEGLARDDFLDNITLYWLTNTAISSARHFAAWEQPELFVNEMRTAFKTLR
jgi:hypothetical protein